MLSGITLLLISLPIAYLDSATDVTEGRIEVNHFRRLPVCDTQSSVPLVFARRKRRRNLSGPAVNMWYEVIGLRYEAGTRV